MTRAEIHRRILTQYGDSALPHRGVYEWIEDFKGGRARVTHEEGAGRASTSTTDKEIREMVMANRRILTVEVTCFLQIRFGSAYRIFHEQHKRKRVEVCQLLIDRYNNEGEESLNRLDTGVEPKVSVWIGNILGG